MDKQAPKLPEIYFDTRAGSYWLRLAPSRFLNLDARNVKLHLMRNKFYIDPENDFGLKAGDSILLQAQVDRHVDYAGPLAGHKCGIFETSAGKKVLVTSETAPVKPIEGDCDWLLDFLTNLLGREQCEHVLLWLKVAHASLLAGDFRPGQLLVLAGPSGCGKSFLQLIITEFFGGRFCNPWRYMAGLTQFNADICGAEHLVIEDEDASQDLRSRRKFGASIKQITVVTNWSVHAKGRDAVPGMPMFKRGSLSVNDEPENLCIIPPLDDSLLDKISLLKCSPAPLDAERKKNWDNVKRGLPALAYFCRTMRIPKKLTDDRYGVKAYHNPDLLDLLSGLSPEIRLLEFIEQIVFHKRALDWQGTATDLEQELSCSPFSFQIQKLLSFSSAAGTFLARLQRRFPERFAQAKNNGKTVWTIRKKL